MKRTSAYVKAISNRALLRLSLCAIGFCICLGAHAGTITFAPQFAFGTGPAPYGVAIADINRDGKLDVVTANYNTAASGAAVLLSTTSLNASTPSFAAWQGFATELDSYCITTADINKDGAADLIVADKADGTLSVLLNTTAAGAGTSNFATQQLFAVGLVGTEQTIFVITADINGDGKTDMIAANYAIGTISVFLNTTTDGAATASFSSPAAFASGTGTSSTGPRAVASADMNGDGKLDVVVVNRNDNTISVFFNTTAVGSGTPTFAAQQIFAAGTLPVSVALADINGDSKPDVVVANVSTATISVLLNTTVTGAPVPTFGALQPFTTGITPEFVASGDIDGDGKLDLVVANYTDNTASVLLNTTSGGATVPAFAAQQTFPVGLHPFAISIADINGDGRPDLVVANVSDSTVSVLLNTTQSDTIFADGFQ